MAKNNETNRFVIAAKRRAAIISILTANDKPTTMREIFDDDRLKEFNFTISTLHSFMMSMKKSGLIDSVKTNTLGRKPGYYLLNNKTKADKIINPVKRPYTKKVKELTVADLKLDIIKETGHVRLQINGLIIEIGVI